MAIAAYGFRNTAFGLLSAVSKSIAAIMQSLTRRAKVYQVEIEDSARPSQPEPSKGFGP
jgi:hypothetical protein